MMSRYLHLVSFPNFKNPGVSLLARFLCGQEGLKSYFLLNDTQFLGVGRIIL